MTSPIPPQADIESLAGYQFPGGEYLIAHWENFLLSGCTGADILPAGLAHPIALFHLPIIGAGTSIAQMFELGQAESDLSILIESYEWNFIQQLREETNYKVAGSIRSAQRCQNDAGQYYDRIQFYFEVSEQDDKPVANSTITWHFTRNTL